jgi:glycosyltransferase involved in cell wall biosynthesis
MTLRAKTPVILDTRVLSGSGGGPDKTLINSPKYLARAGYAMKCAYLHDPTDPGFEVLQNKAAARGVGLISVADGGARDWRVVPRMLDVCRRERVDVWHGHDYKTNLLGLILKRFYPMRLVTTAHGWVHNTSRTPLYYAIDRATLRYYERVLCVSDDLVDACRKARVPASRCDLLENGIDLDDYRRTRTPSEARRALGFADRVTIGAAGRLSKEKGFDLLIDAVHGLIAAGREVQLLIAGEGDEADRLRARIEDGPYSDRIRLLGYRADLTALYECFDLYVLSSHREGLPNVLLEAMAMHVPVVATRINGVPRLIGHGVNGWLVEPGSAAALGDGISRMLGDVQYAERLAAEARRTVETRFSFARRMDRLAAIYDRMFGRKNGPDERRNGDVT